MTTMKRIALARRPVGEPVDEDFRLEEIAMPEPGEGEVLVEVLYLSLDPYMRGRMDDAKSYSAPVPIGGTMEGGAVGRVIKSNDPSLAEGDHVFGMFGWASHGVQPAKMCRKLDASAPLSAALGVLGMPGFTGWHGLTKYGRPKAGETLVVAAATGPVGSMVGQVAKSMGLRVIGIAGGADKCAMATETFGFDVCLDHRAYDSAADLRKAIAAETPNGVDIYFENVGGMVLEAVLPLMNVGGRIPVCGMIAWYNAGALGEGAENQITGPKLWRTILVNRLAVTGFIISDHWARYPEFLKTIAPQVASGRLAYVEDVADGLENAPQAFMGLLKGRNVGKQVVKIA
jgi:NADPH-dependent curcumin reductase CurA